ncbi:hypothetical protein BST61_g5388 [Cercospora zeina]
MEANDEFSNRQSQHGDTDYEPNSAVGLAGCCGGDAPLVTCGQGPGLSPVENGFRACDGIDESSSAPQTMGNETVSRTLNSGIELPKRLILSFGEIISDGFDLISEALMPGLHSYDCDILSVPREGCSRPTSLDTPDNSPSTEISCPHRGSTHSVECTVQGTANSIRSTSPHSRYLTRRSLSTPNSTHLPHPSSKRSRAMSASGIETERAAYLGVVKEHPSLQGVSARGRGPFRELPEVATAPELGVLPEDYGQDSISTLNPASQDVVDALDAPKHGISNLQSPNHPHASPETSGFSGENVAAESNDENEGRPSSSLTGRNDHRFANQEAMELEATQNIESQDPGLMVENAGTAQSKSRRNTRGTFELDGNSWIPQTPKVGPSVGGSSSFEQLKKSLRMTPILKQGESPEQATKRHSTLQKPHRLDSVESEQQGRKDSGGGLVT